MSALVFDTEYVWVPGCEREDRDGNDRAPHPPNATVESIAFVSVTDEIKLGVIQADTERDRVGRFVSRWAKSRPRLVTFNGRCADTPLLVARLMHHGIAAPEFAGSIHLGYRYRHEQHLDLQDVLGAYGAQRRGGMADWARCVGWPGKVDGTGADVAAKLAEPGGRTKVDAYCLGDAVQTTAVFLRWQLLMTEIDAETYRVMARRLLEATRADERVAHLAEQVDTDRWLLEERKDAAA